MRTLKRAMLLLLAMSMLLSGCAMGLKAEETVAPTAAPAPTAEPTEAPTEAPTEPPEPELYEVRDTVLPEADVATGTLKFYIKGQEVYAGGPVSSILDAGVRSYDDFNQIVQPWNMSKLVRVRVELADTKDSDKPYLYFVAMNQTGEPQKLADCTIYSLTVNGDYGVEFGSGREETHFISGETTMDEIYAAYGEPGYAYSEMSAYWEIAYYQPFSCAYFTFYNGRVRQIFTYYSANVFGDLAENFDHDLGSHYFGNDSYILMSQYMDVTPYLPTNEEPLPEGTGVVESLEEKIILGETEIQFDVYATDMPSPFGEAFVDLLYPVGYTYYIRGGRVNAEEFVLINWDYKKGETYAHQLRVKGVVTENKFYTNWGADNSDFNTFKYENLTQDSTIDDIIAQYGQPKEMNCTSYARAVFVWLHYEDKAGNTLQICVDPILNQIRELKVSKYYDGERIYL